MEIKRKKCHSILSESGLYSVDYSLNPYSGCQHGCRYCYATYMKKFTKHNERWGEFVDIKTNAPYQLRKDLREKETGNILLSSVTDPYQLIEQKTNITQRILKILKNHNFKINILTKGSTIKRDLDLIKEIGDQITVGQTINFLDEINRRIWEPRASKIKTRINILKKLSKNNIRTYIHVGPYLEGITDLESITEKLDPIVDEIQIENLNLQNQKQIQKTINKHYPDLENRYKEIIEDDRRYKKKLIDKTRELREKTDTKITLFMD